MEWGCLDIESWKREAFSRLKNDLYSTKENRFLSYESFQASHLVIVFGKSQVGKTTLILNMIGLKDDSCFHSVYNTLRGGVPKGDSSTSTAIIYSQSENDCYAFGYTTLEGEVYFKSESLDEKGMIEALKEIREKVERNNQREDLILNIYIPKTFFLDEIQKDKITIVDLPGIESRNSSESPHVRALMTRYIPLASVCVVACRLDNIEGLKDLQLPGNVDWKFLDHKYLLVLTHAYNDASIRRFFDVPEKDRKTSFYDFVMEGSTKEVRKILGSANKTEIYPIEMGENLKNIQIRNEEDKRVVVETKDKVLAQLRRSIISHKGNHFHSALLELKAIVEYSDESRIKEVEEKMKEIKITINNLQIHIDKLVSCNSQSSKKLKEIDSEIKEFDEKINSLKALNLDFSHEIFSEIRKYMRDKKLDESKIRDEDEGILKKMLEVIEEKSEATKNKISKIKAWNCISWDKMKSDLKASIYRTYKDRLCPPKNIIKKFMPFLSGPHIDISEVKDICAEIAEEIKDSFSKHIDPLKKDLETERKELDEKKKSELKSQKERKAEISSYKEKMKKSEEKIRELTEEEEKVRKNKEQDREVLGAYLSVAKDEYLKYREEIKNQTKSSHLSIAEKTKRILFLGVLDQDYIRTVNEHRDE